MNQKGGSEYEAAYEWRQKKITKKKKKPQEKLVRAQQEQTSAARTKRQEDEKYTHTWYHTHPNSKQILSPVFREGFRILVFLCVAIHLDGNEPEKKNSNKIWTIDIPSIPSTSPAPIYTGSIPQSTYTQYPTPAPPNAQQ